MGEIDPLDVILAGMGKASGRLPTDWESLFGGSAHHLAVFLAKRIPTLPTEDITILVGIGGLLLRQDAKNEAERALVDRLNRPEGSA